LPEGNAHLKEVFAKFGNNAKFAMVGLSLDPKIEAPRAYAAKEGLRWKQAFLGEWSKSTLPTQYGVEGIPATFLVDPDGKIAAKDLRGLEIIDTLETLLPAE
jgi:hypothetical protein